MKNSEGLSNFITNKKQMIDERLPLMIEELSMPAILKEAMIYSLKAGGKRLRPILIFATVSAFDKDEKVAIPIACALEMLHTYSLIHDDLPSMDDDDLRRGLPTNHKVYGEAIAILAGDALLTESIRVIADMDSNLISDLTKIKLISSFTKAAGPEGMVGGQAADLLAEEKQIELNELEYIHEHKTGKLLAYAVEAGAIISGATEDQLKSLRGFARHLGLAFQIRDDILDIEGDETLLGKPVGSDTDNQKSTYPQLLSLEGAKQKCIDHLNKAKNLLYQANVNHGLLEELADYIVNRNH